MLLLPSQASSSRANPTARLQAEAAAPARARAGVVSLPGTGPPRCPGRGPAHSDAPRPSTRRPATTGPVSAPAGPSSSAFSMARAAQRAEGPQGRVPARFRPGPGARVRHQWRRSGRCWPSRRRHDTPPGRPRKAPALRRRAARPAPWPSRRLAHRLPPRMQPRLKGGGAPLARHHGLQRMQHAACDADCSERLARGEPRGAPLVCSTMPRMPAVARVAATGPMPSSVTATMTRCTWCGRAVQDTTCTDGPMAAAAASGCRKGPARERHDRCARGVQPTAERRGDGPGPDDANRGTGGARSSQLRADSTTVPPHGTRAPATLARARGHGTLVTCNLFAYRCSKPNELRETD